MIDLDHKKLINNIRLFNIRGTISEEVCNSPEMYADYYFAFNKSLDQQLLGSVDVTNILIRNNHKNEKGTVCSVSVSMLAIDTKMALYQDDNNYIRQYQNTMKLNDDLREDVNRYRRFISDISNTECALSRVKQICKDFLKEGT